MADEVVLECLAYAYEALSRRCFDIHIRTADDDADDDDDIDLDDCDDDDDDDKADYIHIWVQPQPVAQQSH